MPRAQPDECLLEVDHWTTRKDEVVELLLPWWIHVGDLEFAEERGGDRRARRRRSHGFQAPLREVEVGEIVEKRRAAVAEADQAIVAVAMLVPERVAARESREEA